MYGIKVRYWNRYNETSSKEVNPYLYYFLNNQSVRDGVIENIVDDTIIRGDISGIIPPKFLKIPSTALYEYGGSHKESLAELTLAGFSDIMEVKNV
jgi:hypothetical protein